MKLIVNIERGDFNNESMLWDDSIINLRTSGCDCCSDTLPATAENISAAIKDLEDMIAQLKSLPAATNNAGCENKHSS